MTYPGGFLIISLTSFTRKRLFCKMGLRTVHFIVAVVIFHNARSLQTLNASDREGEDGAALSSEGGTYFFPKYPHPDLHKHEEKKDFFRSARSQEVEKIVVADTGAKSDSKTGNGMASSHTSAKGNAAFVSRKYRRSLDAVEVVLSDTYAKSNSKSNR